MDARGETASAAPAGALSALHKAATCSWVASKGAASDHGGLARTGFATSDTSLCSSGILPYA